MPTTPLTPKIRNRPLPVDSRTNFGANTSPIDSSSDVFREAAVDIRNPLAGARESIRMVRDGELGPVSATQRSFLSGALDQCEVIDFLASEMSTGEIENTLGSPVHRQWTTAGELIEAIRFATTAIQSVRGISLRVDALVPMHTACYVDPAAIVRLVTNLVVHASRSCRSGQNICLRVEPEHHGGSVLWTVIDRGDGLDPVRLKKLASPGVSWSGSAGLGLSVARRLATATYSTLDIDSRPGRGTRIAFRVPAGSAAGVAATYSRWRLQIRRQRMRPVRRSESGTLASEATAIEEMAAEATKPMSSNRDRKPGFSGVRVGPQWKQPQTDNKVMVGWLSVGALVPRENMQPLDKVLQQSVSTFDFVYPVDDTRYVYGIDTTPKRFAERVAMIEGIVRTKLPEVRLHWSDPQTMTINHGWVTRMSDLLVRQSLSGSVSAPMIDRDADCPAGDSGVSTLTAAARLDAEIRHLGRRLNQQTQTIREHAAKLRR